MRYETHTAGPLALLVPNPPYVLAVAAVIVVMAAPADAAGRQRTEATRTVDRTVTVSAPSALRVEHRNGDVRVKTHGRNEVQIHAVVHAGASRQGDADAFANAVQIDIQQMPGSVTIQTRYPERRAFFPSREISYSVDYDVLVPEWMSADIRNAFGNVALAGLKADSLVSNSQGRVNVSDCNGRCRIENRFGAIDIVRLSGDVVVTGSNGAVSAVSISGPLSITNRFGDVTVTTIKGDCTVNNSNGKIVATSITGRADLRTTFGAVEARDVGTLMLTSANGAVTGERIAGPATIRASFGGVDLRDVEKDVTVESSNGAVRLANVRGNADARTTFGSMDASNITGRLQVISTNGPITIRQIGGGADLAGRFGRIDAQMVKGGLKVMSSNGNVHATDVDGTIYLKTSFGLVQADRVRGPLTVDNNNGSVQAAEVSGSANVTTSFGPVMLSDIEGRVDVRNHNGAINAALRAGTGCHDIALATSFGPIQVRVPQAGYRVTAQTSFGRVSSDVPITATGSLGGNTVAGTIGSGGCMMQLTNTNGDIQILRR